MCGFPAMNIGILSNFFYSANELHGMDVSVVAEGASYDKIRFIKTDLRLPFDNINYYDVILVIKPPLELGEQLKSIFNNLKNALENNGYMFVIFAELSDVDSVVDILDELRLRIEVSERNKFYHRSEPEHKWVLLCKKQKNIGTP